MRGGIRSLVTLAVASLALAGCGPAVSSTVDARAGSAGPVGDAVTGAAVVELLRDSWVSDGDRGYFLDAVRSRSGTPMSLYRTRWWLRLGSTGPGGTAGVGGTTGVRPDSLRSWLAPALDGRLSGSGLPAVAQVDYAVAALSSVRATVDAARVARTVEALRRHGQYRGSAGADSPDWGSTAVAVRVLTELRLPVPAEVVDAAADRLRELAAGTTTQAQLSEAVSLIEIAGHLGPGFAGRVPSVPGLAAGADQALAAMRPDAVWLSARSALRQAAAQLGGSLPPVDPASCAGLVGGTGGVRLPGQAVDDPQATYYAVQLGCRGARVPAPPAHSRAGWPEPDAGTEALGASVVGLRLARLLGIADAFAAPLDRQARSVWLPVARHEDRPVDLANLALLGAALGAGSRLGAQVAAALPVDPAARTDAELLVRLVALRYTPAGPAHRSARTWIRAAADRGRSDSGDSDRSMVRAGWLVLAADLLGDPALRTRAMAEAAALRVAPGRYAGGRPADGAPLAASFTASLTGVRLDAPAPADDVRKGWTLAGFCAVDRCAETRSDLAHLDHPSLRSLYALAVADRHAYDQLFPIAF